MGSYHGGCRHTCSDALAAHRIEDHMREFGRVHLYSS